MRLSRRQSTSWLTTILVLVISLGFAQQSSGQRVGIDICACSPSQYEFKFDFTLYCPPINITQGDAVVDTSCAVSPFQDSEVADLVPIAVQEITVLELDQNLDTLYQEIIRGFFNDGDTFTYSSVVAQGGITDPMALPRGIQFNLVGINRLEQPIINSVIITFSNDCQAYPVLIPGQYAGWVRFLDLQDPLDEYCNPISEMPSAAPSPGTPDPTAAPIPGITPAPTPDPTPNPTLATPAPTFPPAPTTPGPTVPPSTKVPTVPSSTKVPHSTPTTAHPTMSMSMPSMHIDIIDLLEDEFGLPNSKCTEGNGSNAEDKKKSRADQSGKGGSKGTKKMGKGGEGGRSGSSSSKMTDPSLKSSKGKGGKGSGLRRLRRYNEFGRSLQDCDGNDSEDSESGKAQKKAGKSGMSSNSEKGSKKKGKGGKGSGAESGSSSKGQYKISKKSGGAGSEKMGKGHKSSGDESGSSKGQHKMTKSESRRRFII